MTSSMSIEYEYVLDRHIWLLDETLTGTTIPDQSGSGSTDNEEVLHTP